MEKKPPKYCWVQPTLLQIKPGAALLPEQWGDSNSVPEQIWGVSCECMMTSHVTWLVPSALILWGGHRMESLISVGHQDTWGFHGLSMAFPKEVNFIQIKKKTKKQGNEEGWRSDWVVTVCFLNLISPKAVRISSTTHKTFLTHH